MSILTKQELESFAKSFKTTRLKEGTICFGSFILKAHRIANLEIQNFSGKDLLDFRQQYRTIINKQKIGFYIQLYKNVTSTGNRQFRLASYSRTDKTTGMIFSINMSKQKDASGQLFLTSKFTFTQQPKGNKDLATAHRKLKQQVFAEILNNLDFDLTDNNDILFGIFDLKAGRFLNTTSEKFLQDFLIVSILKGHFMSNKGYEIEFLPSFKSINTEMKTYESGSKNIESILPTVIKDLRAKRAIPLSVRYKVLDRDKSTCAKCGRTPRDGVKLHIDHIIPHSRNGLTVLNNLRILCSNCNIGRSNNYSD